MADEYIDYWEIGEYTDHFVARSRDLVGAHKLVDIEALRVEVGNRAARVKEELTRAGIERSRKRSGSGDVESFAVEGRREVERFWNFLGSLDEEIAHDRAAFFAGDKLGTLSTLKPADVKSKVIAVLHGFAAPLNKALPDHVKWRKKLEAVRDELTTALEGRGGAHSSAIKSTAQLVTAREQFLVTYNGVAKPLVRGLLAQLGRKEEYELFFGDLLANESATKAPTAAPPPPA